MHFSDPSAGFSLIEVMLGSVLGLVLIGCLLQIYLTTQRVYQLQQAGSALQENGRFIIFFLNQHLHQAGLDWCQNNSADIDQMAAVHGYDSSAVPKRRRITPHKGCDVIIISECVKHHGRYYFRRVPYFIAKTVRRNQRGREIDALFYKPFQRRVELVPNVVAMKLRYGVSDGENVVAYKPAAAVKHWNKVVSILLSVRLTSQNPLATGYLQQQWQSLIALRERR